MIFKVWEHLKTVEFSMRSIGSKHKSLCLPLVAASTPHLPHYETVFWPSVHWRAQCHFVTDCSKPQ